MTWEYRVIRNERGTFSILKVQYSNGAPQGWSTDGCEAGSVGLLAKYIASACAKPVLMMDTQAPHGIVEYIAPPVAPVVLDSHGVVLTRDRFPLELRTAFDVLYAEFSYHITIWQSTAGLAAATSAKELLVEIDRLRQAAESSPVLYYYTSQLLVDHITQFSGTTNKRIRIRLPQNAVFQARTLMALERSLSEHERQLCDWTTLPTPPADGMHWDGRSWQARTGEQHG